MNDADVAEIAARLHAQPASGSAAASFDRIRALEDLASMIAAVQLGETNTFRALRRAENLAEGLSGRDAERGVAAEVALARRMSPYRAQRYLGLAAILPTELPNSFAALARGEISEWKALLVARETIWLTREDRAHVDAQIATRFDGLGDRRLEAAVKKLAYELDPEGFTERSRNAAKDRRVSMRPAPDTMVRLSALLPVVEGVAAYAALVKAADTCTAAGDERGRGQIMADTLVERVTGQANADAVPVEINVVMPHTTLLQSGDQPAVIPGHGPIPAPLARELALTGDAPRWLRRLYEAPGTGQLAAMDTKRRTFTANQRKFIELRDDGTCTTPYCDAPIRHIDHAIPWFRGGKTSVANGNGKCAACNYAKQAPGWQTAVDPDGITTRTPSGHAFRHEFRHAPPGTITLTWHNRAA